MSAAFRLAKKKYSQHDIRKLMKEHKAKSQPQKSAEKIESPLAKYNDAGELMCILCKSVVRSEDVWKVHINAKQHKENVALAKQLKEKTNNFTSVPAKRPASPSQNGSSNSKKPKSILKNTTSANPVKSPVDNKLPSDFFDNSSLNMFKKPLPPPKQKAAQTFTDTSTATKLADPEESPDDLPEGFFDDPVQDAKVRNLDYKDPIEEEWDKFQKEMREESSVSNAIIAEDQDEATADRQIDEIDEQMRNWTRVLDLEKKIQEVVIAEKTKVHQMEIDNDKEEAAVTEDNNDEDDDEDEDFDEFLDWRAKKLK